MTLSRFDKWIFAVPLLSLLFLCAIDGLNLERSLGPIFFTLITLFDLSHLFLVFWRSHGNPIIFQRFKKRFFISPLIIIPLLFLNSSTLFWIAGFVALWDLWHVSMQNFGFARIYHAKDGGDPKFGRERDMLLFLSLSAIPLLLLTVFFTNLELGGGAVWADLFDSSTAWGAMNAQDTVDLNSLQGLAVIGCFIFAIGLVLYEVITRKQKAKLKIYFSVSLLLSLILSFYFLGTVFTVMLLSIIHGVQYYMIVWKNEHQQFEEKFIFQWSPKFLFVLVHLLGCAFLYKLYESYPEVLVVFVITIRMLHFWYDGFIWSVRKGEA